ncbi:MAG: sulfatase-like hydrolase/transferase [Acidimicrobiia bacterium]
MGRKILFITTDQQRYDALGCNGGEIARTPVVDALAAAGVNYRRAHNQNVVCMPARSTMLTGQYVRTHGVYANGVPLPQDAPSVARVLADAGYRTALIGKAHFEPGFDPDGRWPENRFGRKGNDISYGPHRGFEHLELAMHGPLAFWHYGTWLRTEHPDEARGFYALVKDGHLNNEGGGDTGLEQVASNPVPREHYHTDWVADRAIAWLDTLDADDDWFVWLSFPDPHHPWDPPASEVSRVPWRDLDLPPGHPGSVDACRDVLARKPKHWLDWFDGRFNNREGGPTGFVPAAMTHDQVREVNALVHVENELIDEACGRVLRRIDERGWGDDTDIIFTTDHGELQGDYGLLFKGPYHCDALMRVPLIWRPAPSAGVTPAEVTDPLGHVDLAATFCAIAGEPTPDWMQGDVLPLADGSGRERVITEWDSQFDDIDMHLRSIHRDGWTCTTYEPGGIYDGTEGELYDLGDDPRQLQNRWDDPACSSLRSDLVTDLRDHLPPARRTRLTVEAPA